jgi:hypothetical protein
MEWGHGGDRTREKVEDEVMCMCGVEAPVGPGFREKADSPHKMTGSSLDSRCLIAVRQKTNRNADPTMARPCSRTPLNTKSTL